MGRIITSGFEWQHGSASGFIVDGSTGGSGTWANETTNHRSGLCAATVTIPSAGLAERNFTFANTVPLGGTAYARVYFRKSGNPGTNPRTVCAINGGNNGYSVILNTDGTLSLTYSVTSSSATATPIGSPSRVLSNDTYYRIELSQLIAVGGTSYSGEALLDGTSFASESAVTHATFAQSASNFMVGCSDNNSHTGTVTYIFDDVAVNDSSFGSSQLTWPGPGKVVLLVPITPDNAVGANWVAGAGGTTNLFDALDNKPPVGVALASATNTSQIKNVTKDTTGNYDANMTTYTTAGIIGSDTINVVHPHWNLGSSGAGTISHAMLLVSNPVANSGTESTFTPSSIAGTYAGGNWFWQLPNAQIVYGPSPTLGTSPVMRVGKRTSSTTAAMCDAMGLYVDYTPGPQPVGVADGNLPLIYQRRNV